MSRAPTQDNPWAADDESLLGGFGVQADLRNIGRESATEISHTQYWEGQNSFASFTETGDEQPPQVTGIALPEVGGGPSPLPLMLWWALLLGLSSLARYEPATWVAALDLDSSQLAVGLERVLDIAEEQVPQRVLGELTRS